MFGRKTCKYFYETDEFPNPRQTQPKKNQVKSGIWATFSHSKYFFVGWDWFYMGNILQETQPNQILRKHPNVKAKMLVVGLILTRQGLFIRRILVSVWRVPWRLSVKGFKPCQPTCLLVTAIPPNICWEKICCPRNIWARNISRGADFCEIFPE